jgi:chromate transporter
MRVWLRIGLLSFGGPAAQIAMLHREVVERRGWVGERRFLHALSFCALLPGPEAMQLATYLGWLMHGVAGGIVAGLLFVLPGAAVLLGLSLVFVSVGHVPAIEGVFFGLKCAVLALVIQAVPRIGRRALKTRTAWVVAAMAFAALFFFAAPFPAVVLAAGAVGAAAPGRFAGHVAGEASDAADGLIDRVLRADPARPGRQAARARLAGAAAAALWLAPVALLAVFAPGRYADIAWFFSKMAVVTLGGAYAVLAYVAQDAVQSLHWLRPSDMLTGLGLAETTPGPLILVLQFVGFLAGFSAPGPLHGLIGGVAAAALTLWVTFLPCFAFVFLGAPAVESLAANRALTGALAAVTAAVVGVIANLALWFALHLLFTATTPIRAGLLRFEMPLPGSLDPVAALLAVLAALCLFRLQWRVPAVLALTAAAGLLLRLIL